MDFPYPSQKDDQFSAHLSPFSRKCSLILKDSLKNIPDLPPVPNKVKKQIQSLIQLDYDYELRNIISKQVINLNAQVGREGSQQTFVHLCCRLNAIKCLTFLLKTYYLFYPEDYVSWVNAGNQQRMTGVMLCSLTGSNHCLQYLLQIGGIDIHLIDSNKLSAYEIALNSKNDIAVKLLMEYENGTRKSKIINTKIFQEPIELKPNKKSVSQVIYKCLLDCFTCQIFLDDKRVKDIKDVQNYGKKSSPLLEIGIQNFFKQQIEIGFPQDQIAAKDVHWKLMGKYQERGEGGVLYNTFSPFDIEDVSHPIQNFLIVFQSLSHHPWLIRRIIQPDKRKNGNYVVTLYPKNIRISINIDANLPFFSDSNQLLFIADKKEGWPMLIQKAFAKYYGSYYRLNQLNTIQLMRSLTGWPVLKKQITTCSQTVELMQKLNTLGYMYVLTGKPNSLLYSPKNPNSIFNVLTFYTKGNKRMILINCPFVDPAWVQKEYHEILALKILRGYHNCRQQMAIWVEEERLNQFFSSIVIAPIRPGYEKYSLSVSAYNKIFFGIYAQKKLQDPIVLYLVQCESGSVVKTSQVSGFFAQKQKIRYINQQIFYDQILTFQGEEGQYLFSAKVPKGKYQVISWACHNIKIDPIQQSFGELEWINCIRKNIQSYWIFEQETRVQHTDQYTLAIVKSQRKYIMKIFEAVQIIEGISKNKQQITLIEDGQFQYCILRGIVNNLILQQIS